MNGVQLGVGQGVFFCFPAVSPAADDTARGINNDAAHGYLALSHGFMGQRKGLLHIFFVFQMRHTHSYNGRPP
jgi:hypothetical protein